MKSTTPSHPYRISPATLSCCLLMAWAPVGQAQAPSGPAQTSAGAPLAAAPSPSADTSPEHTSYLFGLTFGEQLHSFGITDQVDTAAIARGIKDALQGKKSTQADQLQIRGFVRTAMTESLARNHEAAKAFAAKNGQEKNVKTTASGLQYKVLVPGDTKAATVAPTDEVTVNYRGKFLDGTEFDSSYARGTPATFKVNGVIPGWQEALVLMKPGAKWQLFVPPELAYGDNPRPGIPGGSMLIFDVELMSVKAGDAAPAPAASSPPAPSPQSHKAVPPLTPTPNQ
jgi:FKBP-type peptidyl-prolyl cis-trans isomerase FklB